VRIAHFCACHENTGETITHQSPSAGTPRDGDKAAWPTSDAMDWTHTSHVKPEATSRVLQQRQISTAELLPHIAKQKSNYEAIAEANPHAREIDRNQKAPTLALGVLRIAGRPNRTESHISATPDTSPEQRGRVD
jgi:hypothetical protein